MKGLLITILLLTFALPALGQAIPDNSSPNAYGSGWTCNKGYYRSGDRCVVVAPPANASLNFLGNGWECNRGFYRAGQECLKVEPPPNAGLNYLGNGWECNRGYFRSGRSCSKVLPPENAGLNYLGNGWECNRGYYRSGQSCVKVVVPDNAKMNYLGNGWECNRGFRRSGRSCVAMTAQELKNQKELEKAVLAEMQRRRAAGVSGDDCESEYKTNASVCVEITGGRIDCNADFAGTYYQDCDVEIDYDVETDYSGGAYLDVDVECEAEIEYKGRGIYTVEADSDRQDESHNLYAHGRESETLRFNFSFGPYQEVTSAKISSANCEVGSVDLY